MEWDTPIVIELDIFDDKASCGLCVAGSGDEGLCGVGNAAGLCTVTGADP